MDLGLAGRRAIVTGGSRGIGRAVAQVLVGEGAACTIVARTAEDLDRTAADLSAGPGSIHTVAADLRDPDAAAAVVAQAVALMGGVDILVNSAARASGGQPESFDDVTDDLLRSDFEEKYLGYLRMSRAVVPHMRAEGWGRIVTISGLAARRTGGLSAGARNAAVVHLTATIARLAGRDGITANTVHPGLTVTERLDETWAPRIAVEEARSSIGRLVTAPEVAAVIAFLASDAAACISGESISVSGGDSDEVRY